MASAFSRTMRSVQSDRFSIAVAGLIIAVVLAVVWGKWFFTAQVTFYETSQRLSVAAHETVVTDFPSDARGSAQRATKTRIRHVIAEFPLEARDRVKPGQPAFVSLMTTAGKHAGAIPAVVVDLSEDHQRHLLHVELTAMLDADRPNPFEEGAKGEVKIETRYATPATLMMQASGLFTETPSTTFSPQPPRNIQ